MKSKEYKRYDDLEKPNVYLLHFSLLNFAQIRFKVSRESSSSQ